jgi:methylated-DNA-protein-cysteine methyltransferase-like protein
MNDDASPFERFCIVLAQLPKGKVCSYGRLAEMASLGNARLTCRWLRALPSDSQLPWHRVVSAQGKLAELSNTAKQRRILEAEGVVCSEKGRLPKH